jgi:hypothetical protein
MNAVFASNFGLFGRAGNGLAAGFRRPGTSAFTRVWDALGASLINRFDAAITD